MFTYQMDVSMGKIRRTTDAVPVAHLLDSSIHHRSQQTVEECEVGICLRLAA